MNRVGVTYSTASDAPPTLAQGAKDDKKSLERAGILDYRDCWSGARHRLSIRSQFVCLFVLKDTLTDGYGLCHCVTVHFGSRPTVLGGLDT